MSQPQRIINEIILHCTATLATQPVTIDQIKRWHCQDNGWLDIGYHFVISQDGTIHKGRNVNKQGAHCKGHNQNSIGICYIGGLDDFTGTPADTRTPMQKQALLGLVRNLMQKYGLRPEHIHCHNEFSNRACPCFTIASFRRELSSF